MTFNNCCVLISFKTLVKLNFFNNHILYSHHLTAQGKSPNIILRIGETSLLVFGGANHVPKDDGLTQLLTCMASISISYSACYKHFCFLAVQNALKQ